jgi:hypothetical protein
MCLYERHEGILVDGLDVLTAYTIAWAGFPPSRMAYSDNSSAAANAAVTTRIMRLSLKSEPITISLSYVVIAPYAPRRVGTYPKRVIFVA